MVRIGVAVVCFDRPAATRRALHAVRRLRQPPGCEVSVVVSQEAPSDPRVTAEIRAAAERGPLEHVQHAHHQGLRGHLLRVGSMAADFDLLVVVEDDVVLSPAALEVLMPAVRAYGDAEEVAQFSLYAPPYLEPTRPPFLPLDDGAPGLLLPVPMSWGFAVLPQQWERFAAHLAAPSGSRAAAEALLPPFAGAWPRGSSWKREFLAFMLASAAWTWVPSASLSTQFGDAGTHHPAPIRHGRVPLRLVAGAVGVPHPPLEDLTRYDLVGEIAPESLHRLAPETAAWGPVVVDLQGLRPPEDFGDGLVLTTRPTRGAIRTFGAELSPPAANVVLGIEGEGITLAHARDVIGRTPRPRPVRAARAAPNAFAVELLVGEDHLFRRMRLERILGRGVVRRVVPLAERWLRWRTRSRRPGPASVSTVV